MNVVDLESLAWSEQRSPKGRFHHFRRNLSLALGGLKDVGEWGGGHPFDVEQFRVPPGAANFPLHAHSAQWEFYLVLSGTGTLQGASSSQEIGAGSTFICPPGEAHQISNTGGQDLVYLVIADHPRADVLHYPGSGKWGIKPQREFFDMQARDYYEGEE